MSKVIGRLIAGIVTILLGVWFNYLMMPAWNFRSAGMWGFLLLMCIVGIIAFAIAEWISNEVACDDCYYVFTGVCGGLAVIVLLALIIGGVISAQMFNASNYHNIVKIEDGNFENDIPMVTDDTPISIVDVETAQKVGDRTIGGIKNATWYEVDNEYNLIKYQEKFYRISALNYGGFWKYRKAKYAGIPGYVIVNAMTQEAKYIALDEPIKYSPSAHFSFKLERHLRNQYPSYMFGKSFFEIDEEGNPYYITSVKTPTIGWFGGKKELSFIITNACSGESKEYKAEEIPNWIDHAYDLDYLMEITNLNQKYVDGWWNITLFGSKTGVTSTSYQYRGSGFAGYNTTITSNGDIVFYTGVTPANRAESNLGFILANPKTGKITNYSFVGAEESSAQAAAEGLVSNLGYTATFPTVLNVDGAETYFMLLKDKAGLVQRYALCNIKDYTKVVQAESLDTALNLYKKELGMQTETLAEEVLKIEGTIQNLYQTQIDGCTYYCFIIEDSPDLYMSSIKNNYRQVWLKEGTRVTFEYAKSSEEGIFTVHKIQF